MRKIRFRAYYKPENRMIYDIQNEFEERIELGMDCFADYLNNDDFVVEQDTELKDKNGVSIWEGDIVEGTMGTFKVEWYDTASRFDFESNIDMDWHPAFVRNQANEMEVIGNINENPELLEGK